MKKYFYALLVLLVTALFLTEPTLYSQAFLTSVTLWCVSVLPMLFPFMLLSKYAVDNGLLSPLTEKMRLTQKLLKVKSAGINAIFLGLLCGYPVGAKILSDYTLTGRIDSASAKKLSFICGGASPVFCIGTIGAVFLKNALYGLIIYCVSVFCNIITGIVVNKMRYSENTERKDGGLSLFDAMYPAIISCLTVGGFICLFGVISTMAQSVAQSIFPSLNHTTLNLILGLLEMTQGCKAACVLPIRYALPLCAFYIHFGGLCVNTQLVSYYLKCRLKGGLQVLVRAFQGALCALICYLITFLL